MQISFLFLPSKEDPDSFVNKNGKNYFLDFTKQNKLSIHQFIFNHYKKQTDNNPSSMAIFLKKLRFIANLRNKETYYQGELSYLSKQLWLLMMVRKFPKDRL